MATDGIEELQEEQRERNKWDFDPLTIIIQVFVCFSHLCLGVNNFKVIHFWHSRAAEFEFPAPLRRFSRYFLLMPSLTCSWKY